MKQEIKLSSRSTSQSKDPVGKLPPDLLQIARRGVRDKLGVLLPVSAWLVLLIYFSLASPVFLTQTNLLNIIRQSSVLLVVGLAGTFVILIGSIDLSVGSVVTLTGIVTAMAVSNLGNWGVFAALLVGLLCGLLNGVLHAYGKLPSFLVTLGSLFMIQGIGLILCGGRPQAWQSDLVMGMMGGTTAGGFPVIGIWALGIFAIAVFVASRTRFGRYLVAIGDGEKVARMSGVPVDRMKLYAFALSGFMAGLGGVMLAVRSASGSPGAGDPFLLDSIASIVLGGTSLTGGTGGPHRTILGVLVITTLSNGMTITQVDPFYQVAIRGAVVIAAVAVTMRREELGLIVK